MKRELRLLIWATVTFTAVVCLLMLVGFRAAQAQTTLTRVYNATWDEVEGAASYCLYHSAEPGLAASYDDRTTSLDANCVDVPTNTLAWTLPVSVTGNTPGIDYFVVTAIDPLGQESIFSNEVAAPANIDPPSPPGNLSIDVTVTVNVSVTN